MDTPLFWPAHIKGRVLYVLDETLIPQKVVYIKIRTSAQAVRVIKTMKTRAFGQFLVVLNTFLLEIQFATKVTDTQLLRRLQAVAKALNASRPTFPFSEVTGIVIRWAEEAHCSGGDLRSTVQRNILGYMEGIRRQRLDRVARLAGLMRDGDSILTHCNLSGELAMAAALCRREKRKVQFFVTETRPYFQGAKLTCWELKRVGADVTLIADNAVASVMSDALVNKVIVGSDRNCANGDFANKIGTYQMAVCAQEFHIPFYVLTQPSQKVKTGNDIPIEIRDDKELLVFAGKRIVPRAVKGFYPGFDVVPHQYITKAVPIHVK
jgi:methylthioribose-1-phosphate isomerase